MRLRLLLLHSLWAASGPTCIDACVHLSRRLMKRPLSSLPRIRFSVLVACDNTCSKDNTGRGPSKALLTLPCFLPNLTFADETDLHFSLSDVWSLNHHLLHCHDCWVHSGPLPHLMEMVPATHCQHGAWSVDLATWCTRHIWWGEPAYAYTHIRSNTVHSWYELFI